VAAYTLVRNAELLATFDDDSRELADGSILSDGPRIVLVGTHDEVTAEIARRGIAIDREVDATGHVVLPGLVNTHHHFFQTLTRNLAGGQNAELFDWLVTHYPIWARIDADAMQLASRIAAAELLLSGCTTAADHTYLWPNGSS